MMDCYIWRLGLPDPGSNTIYWVCTIFDSLDQFALSQRSRATAVFFILHAHKFFEMDNNKTTFKEEAETQRNLSPPAVNLEESHLPSKRFFHRPVTSRSKTK